MLLSCSGMSHCHAENMCWPETGQAASLHYLVTGLFAKIGQLGDCPSSRMQCSLQRCMRTSKACSGHLAGLGAPDSADRLCKYLANVPGLPKKHGQKHAPLYIEDPKHCPDDLSTLRRRGYCLLICSLALPRPAS